MLKEIYISTEDWNPFNVRAIEIQEFFRVLNLIYYYGCEGKDRPDLAPAGDVGVELGQEEIAA